MLEEMIVEELMRRGLVEGDAESWVPSHGRFLRSSPDRYERVLTKIAKSADVPDKRGDWNRLDDLLRRYRRVTTMKKKDALGRLSRIGTIRKARKAKALRSALGGMVTK